MRELSHQETLATKPDDLGTHRVEERTNSFLQVVNRQADRQTVPRTPRWGKEEEKQGSKIYSSNVKVGSSVRKCILKYTTLICNLIRKITQLFLLVLNIALTKSNIYTDCFEIQETRN